MVLRDPKALAPPSYIPSCPLLSHPGPPSTSLPQIHSPWLLLGLPLQVLEALSIFLWKAERDVFHLPFAIQQMASMIRAGRGQTRSWEPHLGLPWEWQEPGDVSHPHRFPRLISRDLGGKWSGYDLHVCSDWDAGMAGDSSCCTTTLTTSLLLKGAPPVNTAALGPSIQHTDAGAERVTASSVQTPGGASGVHLWTEL